MLDIPYSGLCQQSANPLSDNVLCYEKVSLIATTHVVFCTQPSSIWLVALSTCCNATVWHRPNNRIIIV